MSWTDVDEIRARVARLWERGEILEARLRREPMFPLRLKTSRPGPRDLSQRFDEVRRWVKELEAGSKSVRGYGYQIEWQEVSHRQLGRNTVPRAIVIPTEQDALALIGKRRDAELVSRLADRTAAAFPALEGWLASHPLTLLESADCWERVLAVVGWFREHPRPGVYLRQLDVPGVDTKFVERRRELFTELLDLVLPPDAVKTAATGASAFEERYGLLSKPPLVRFRVLDERLRVHGLTDISIPDTEFARLELPVRQVFITENQVNGLSFPAVPDSIVIFALGYRVDRLARIAWLKTKPIHYWGDIDTHGFAILDLLRQAHDHARSLLMDRETFLAHASLWGREDAPHDVPLANLTDAERSLYDDLRFDRLGDHLRLEQEKIGFGWLQQALSHRPL
jgi:hypothetical protein